MRDVSTEKRERNLAPAPGSRGTERGFSMDALALGDAPSLHGPIERRAHGLLIEPTYGHGQTPPRKPSLKEVLAEWIDAIGFWKDQSRLLPALYAGYHFATFMVFLIFLVRFFSIAAIGSV